MEHITLYVLVISNVVSESMMLYTQYIHHFTVNLFVRELYRYNLSMNGTTLHTLSDLLCFDNFEMVIRTTNNNGNSNYNTYTLGGQLVGYSPNDPNVECSLDDAVCSSNRTYWVNEDVTDPTYRWYYRSKRNANSKNANWVYGKAGGDRIACAPGYVESPLFCTTFVYASDNGGNFTNYSFTSGPCAPTLSPTALPTIPPSNEPTVFPTESPTGAPQCPKSYIFDALEEGLSETLSCPFGWRGSEITRQCDDGRSWTTVSDDCYRISLVLCLLSRIS